MKKLQIINYRKHAFVLSLIIIIIGMVSLAVNGLNLGIDFTGGTVLHLRVGESFDISEVRDILVPLGLEGSFIQKVGHEGLLYEEKDEVIIKTVSIKEEERQQIIGAFQEKWGITETDVIKIDNVGAVIGEELKHNAFLALIIAVVGMIAYITIRFEFKFAISAILALVHDLIVLLTVFSLFKIEINSPFVAAILTIFGYSINDTIVIFDRIRENLKEMKKYDYTTIVNESLSQTLVRTINTSVTTMLVLLALFIFGGITLRPFITALLVGVISGTYSSIFVASPLWLIWKNWELLKKRKVKTA
ncbi:MAG: protein translocase subunit SecF [Firmicutes bacterium HGW-Firmicutes-13]|nr:MAG: protein translocase subunit SecF [Firmicutes bacterium HGW-Firmicutes-13]